MIAVAGRRRNREWASYRRTATKTLLCTAAILTAGPLTWTIYTALQISLTWACDVAATLADNLTP